MRQQTRADVSLIIETVETDLSHMTEYAKSLVEYVPYDVVVTLKGKNFSDELHRSKALTKLLADRTHGRLVEYYGISGVPQSIDVCGDHNLYSDGSIVHGPNRPLDGTDDARRIGSEHLGRNDMKMTGHTMTVVQHSGESFQTSMYNLADMAEAYIKAKANIKQNRYIIVIDIADGSIFCEWHCVRGDI